MGRISSFEISKERIKRFFDREPSNVFSVEQLNTIFEENRIKWRLAKSMTSEQFLDALVKHADFANVKLEFRNLYVNNFFYKKITVLSYISNITKRSYLSHYTSLSWHGLTEQIPKVIYVTHELSKKYSAEVDLIQENIDNAFRKEQRMSENSALFGDYKIILLEGKYSNNLGVETDNNLKDGISTRVTNLERTLIDIVVRPNYAGGVYEVIKAYRQASGKVSINKLVSILIKLEYIYPYHQAIGFYLEKSGAYKDSVIQLLNRFEKKYDFYLTYNMKEMNYSEKWKLFYPKDL
jgi:hypothetical protein